MWSSQLQTPRMVQRRAMYSCEFYLWENVQVLVANIRGKKSPLLPGEGKGAILKQVVLLYS